MPRAVVGGGERQHHRSACLACLLEVSIGIVDVDGDRLPWFPTRRLPSLTVNHHDAVAELHFGVDRRAVRSGDFDQRLEPERAAQPLSASGRSDSGSRERCSASGPAPIS